MTPLNEAEYIEQRVDHQQKWYSKESGENQTNFKRLRAIEIVAAALIPFMSGYASQYSVLEYAVGFLGVLVAVIAGFLSLNRYQENWTNYRATSEALKREKFLYQTRAEPYTASNPFPLLVQRVESILSEENNTWLSQMQNSSESSES